MFSSQYNSHHEEKNIYVHLFSIAAYPASRPVGCWNFSHWPEPQLRDTQPLSPSLTPTASQPGVERLESTQRDQIENQTREPSRREAPALTAAPPSSPQNYQEPQILHDRLVGVWFEV